MTIELDEGCYTLSELVMILFFNSPRALDITLFWSMLNSNRHASDHHYSLLVWIKSETSRITMYMFYRKSAIRVIRVIKNSIERFLLRFLSESKCSFNQIYVRCFENTRGFSSGVGLCYNHDCRMQSKIVWHFKIYQNRCLEKIA